MAERLAKDVQNYVDRSLVLTHAFVPIIEVQQIVSVSLCPLIPSVCAAPAEHVPVPRWQPSGLVTS